MLGDRIAELQLPAMCDEGSGWGWEVLSEDLYAPPLSEDSYASPLSEDLYAPPAGIEVEVVRAWLRNTLEDICLLISRARPALSFCFSVFV